MFPSLINEPDHPLYLDRSVCDNGNGPSPPLNVGYSQKRTTKSENLRPRPRGDTSPREYFMPSSLSLSWKRRFRALNSSYDPPHHMRGLRRRV